MPLLAAVFGAWKELVVLEKLADMRMLQTVWVAWKSLQADAQRTREIEREREEIQRERNKHAEAVQLHARCVMC
eukprot:5426011-Amphidinium_carterae.1